MNVSDLANSIEIDTTPGAADYAMNSAQPSMTTPAGGYAVAEMAVAGSTICLVC